MIQIGDYYNQNTRLFTSTKTLLFRPLKMLQIEMTLRSPDHFRFFHVTFLKRTLSYKFSLQFIFNQYFSLIENMYQIKNILVSKIEILENPFFSRSDLGSGLNLKILRFLQNKNSLLRSNSLKT